MATLIVALDLPDPDRALDLVDRLGDAVSHYKVGAELFTRAGPDTVHELNRRGKAVFLDLKLHDIPTTVARTVEAAATLRVHLLSLHTAGGTAMLRAARTAAGTDGPRLLGVTLLTSHTAADLEEVWDRTPRPLPDEALRLASLAARAGLHGVVASPLEAKTLTQRLGPDFLVATPGIRAPGQPADDQARTAAPADAARAGADYLIVGRPIHAAPDPRAAALAILDEIRRGTP